MARYRRHYRSWRGRSYSKPTKYSALSSLLGDAVLDIRKAFLSLEEDALDSILADYGSIHGDSAGQYARKTYPKWKSGSTKLSGQTMERLIELVPPYLEPDQRHDILLKVLGKHKRSSPYQTIKVNVKDPTEGFREIDQALVNLKADDPLAFIPERVMEAAKWLYDDDMTAARAMIAEATRIETEILRASTVKEVGLLKRTILNGQVKAANYSVHTPVNKLSVVAYTPSKCFVATVCFGQHAAETNALRAWRDDYLAHHKLGRDFIVWYYTRGEAIANTVEKSVILKLMSKFCVGMIAKLVMMRKGAKDE